MGKGFKKGNKFGRRSKGGGRPPLDPEIIELREINRNVITKLLTQYSNMTVSEMRAAKENPKTQVLDHIIISICIKAVQHGDSTRANFLIENMVGKLPQKLSVENQSFHGKMLDKLEEIREEKEVDNDQEDR